MNISRKEIFKAGGAAAVLAGLGIRPARAQVQPHNWDGFNLGNAYYLQKDFTRAVRYFQMATARDTTNPEVYYNLGNAYASQGNFTAAIPAYKKALSQNQDEPDYFNNLAMSYSALGQYDQALAVINDGLKLHGQSELLRENAARIRSGKKELP